MGRNSVLDDLAEVIDTEYGLSDLSVDAFIDEQKELRGAFDVRYLEETTTFGGHTDRYAHFHISDKGTIITVYYWESRDGWLAKS